MAFLLPRVATARGVAGSQSALDLGGRILVLLDEDLDLEKQLFGVCVYLMRGTQAGHLIVNMARRGYWPTLPTPFRP